MKQMMRFLALAVVVAVMALGPTAAMAAPTHGGSIALDHASSFSILSVFAKLLGIQPVAAGNVGGGQRQPAAAPSTVSTSGSGSVSTESAIWGRCRLSGTC